MGTLKRVKKKIRRKKTKFHKIAPSEQVISHGEDQPPPLPFSAKELEARKKLQGAMLMAAQEFMRIHQDEITARAIEILRQQKG